MRKLSVRRALYAIHRCICCCLLYLALSSSSFANQIVLTAFNYPPYMDDTHPEQGLYCELVKEAYRAAGYEVSFEFYPLPRSTQYVLAGKKLGQLGTEWNFPVEARTRDLISVPLFYYRVVGFHLKDRHPAINFSTLADLQHLSIGVIRDSSDARILNASPELKVEAVATGEQVIKKVATQRNDIGFMVELTGLSIIAHLYPDSREQWVMTEDALQGILAQVVFSKHYPEASKYAQALERGIAIIRENGSYHRILEKYYGAGKVPEIVEDLERSLYIIPESN